MTTKTGKKTWRNFLSKFLARLAKTFAFIVTVQSCQNETTTSVERSGPTFLRGFFLCLEKVDILTSWEVILDEMLLVRLNIRNFGRYFHAKSKVRDSDLGHAPAERA